MNTGVFRSEFGVHYLSLNYEIHITMPCFFIKNPGIGRTSVQGHQSDFLSVASKTDSTVHAWKCRWSPRFGLTHVRIV